MARPAGLLGASCASPLRGRALRVPIGHTDRLIEPVQVLILPITPRSLTTEVIQIKVARPAGFEPATLGLAYHYSFRCCPLQNRAFVVWTISSPFQVPHVWPLRNPTIVSRQLHGLALIILRHFYPQSDRLGVILWVKIVALVVIRTVNTIKIDLILIDGLHMRAIFICPVRAKMHGQRAALVHRLALNLNPLEYASL